MTIHYHGTPISPELALIDLGGRHVCISFATFSPTQLEQSLRTMQSVMFDNGAFSIYKKGGQLIPEEYYKWLEPMLGHPHWAVVPDVIGGDVEQQMAMVKTWPFPKQLGAPVWHLGLPLDYLLELLETWPRVCFGSSAEYWEVGSEAWERRMDEAITAISARHKHLPWLHGLRMMKMAGRRFPLASLDSVGLARNYKFREEMPSDLAKRIDVKNTSTAIRFVGDVDRVITPILNSNPRRIGTAGWLSWEIIANGPMTVGEYKAKGGRMNDLKWEILKGRVKLS